MPNGEFVGQIPLPVPDVELEIPGVPEEATSFGALFGTIADFFGGLFGGGGAPAVPTPEQRLAQQTRSERVFGPTSAGLTFSENAQRRAIEEAGNLGRVRTGLGLDPITGRPPIPPPQEGGPFLVTERFRNLPPIPMVPDVVEGPVGFEGIENMPVDAPLLASFLPALRGVAQPTIQGVVGGLAGGFLGEFLRPIQETGLGTVPMRQAVPAPAQLGGCPAEKPHTRILRAIKSATGVSINLSRAKSLIRELGLEAAARCLGIGAMEACALLIVASPRRRRGISASDIRIVKRTARRFDSLKHDLGHLGGRVTHHRRASRHRHTHK